MGRPKDVYENLPENMTFDRQRKRFVVRNPLNGKIRKFAASKEKLARDSAKAVAELVEIEKQREALASGRPTLAGLVDKWLDERMPLMPWAESTRANNVAKMHRIKRELGARTVAHTDCMYIEEWIDRFVETADTFNDWRYAFCLLWSFAVSRKIADVNEPEKIEERSTSKKIEANRKKRKPLDIDGFNAIHDKAEEWLQLAMEQSLITLQGRSEICNLEHGHYRDGWIYTIRDKTSGDSDMAFIRIQITEQLDELRKRSLRMNVLPGHPGVASMDRSPFVVFHKPAHRRKEWTEGKPHWTYVNPDYLSKAFAKARDQVERFANMLPDERPSFHEVRGLGARLYRKAGLSKAAIKTLMTHTNERVTEIYLERGPEGLCDDDFTSAKAPMVLKDVLGR